MDLEEIRRLVIIALFADDELMERFVLKGGNALDVIYDIGKRSSVDIDLSIADDFTDIEDAKTRIFKSLKDRFAANGYIVFDESFEPRPSIVREGRNARWGGYQVDFKIIDRATFEKHENDLEKLRRNATSVSPKMHRTFKIDISKYEFCEAKQETELDDFTIYVYSLPMLAIEKLRAICQQMPEYELRPYSKPRARDFYDIHTIIKAGNFDIATPENAEIVKHIFEAKEVPLNLLGKIKNTKDFHAVDWEAVKQSTSGDLKEFDFYFDFVVGEVNKLKAIGIE